MANDNNIRSFTAADIERYHKGLLSSREKHEMEKAALDDPFLADALEGYAASGADAKTDMEELTRRLAERTEETKVIRMTPLTNRRFNWWKVAALFILAGGAALLVYRTSFNDNTNDIAQVSSDKKAADTPAKESTPTALAPAQDSSSQGLVVDNTRSTASNEEKAKAQPAPKKSLAEEDLGRQEVATLTQKSQWAGPAVTSPVPTEKEKTLASGKFKLDTLTLSGNSTAFSQPYAFNTDKNVVPDAEGVVHKAQINRINQSNNNGYLNNTDANVFRGKVTDAANNALPFANITNTRDHIGTYSDAQGNFALISPDSILNVQVRSVGFENSNVLLQNQAVANQVTLQEDRSLSVRVLDTVKRNANRSRSSNLVLEEPEPVDGWVNYDTYLVNNLNVPEKFKDRRQQEPGEVEVSFEVNRLGNPINIKIEKSLCEACDKEAIRLIRQGPKWKKKKGRTVVKIGF